MNKTTTVLIFFLGALLAGFFLVSREGFFQREVGMPLDTQSVEGATGVAGYNGTPPLLGSEPKPVPIRPYDMADDDPLGTIAEIKRLTKADRDLVVGANAARLLKIKAPSGSSPGKK